MADVEILAVQEVVTAYDFSWVAFWVTVGVIVAVLAAVGVAMSIREYDWSNLVCCILVGVLFGALFGVLMGVVFQTPVSYETRYKVIVSDTMPMSEFYERYEVVSQEGKIFTVRERGSDD